MDRGTIRIIDGKVVMPGSPIWMTVEELSDLFGICSYEIRKRLALIIVGHLDPHEYKRSNGFRL